MLIHTCSCSCTFCNKAIVDTMHLTAPQDCHANSMILTSMAPAKIVLLASVGTDRDKPGLLGDTEDPGDCRPGDGRCCSAT